MNVGKLEVIQALEADQIVPVFQSLVSLAEGQLSGFEVLARWDNPKHGPILPPTFISGAEESGLIGMLTNQLLAKAFVHAPILPAPLTLAVNISPLQMHYASLPCQIRVAAETAGFPLDRITIEITESSLLDDLPRVKAIAAELKSMGCRLALDDFGTGFSSLSNLQSLPFDIVKIDRSFVQNMTTDRDSRKIVAAIIGLGLSLGLTTVAEGVETEEQAAMLLRLGCKIGQGWLYGRPEVAAKLPELISQSNHFVCRAEAQDMGGRTVVSFETAAQLQAIYDGAPVGLAFLDKDLRHVTMNHQFAEVTGVAIDVARGQTVEQVVTPDLYTEIQPLLSRALHGETMTDIEIRRSPAHDGDTSHTMLVSYLPALDEAREVIGISVTVMDITERKRAQQVLDTLTDSHRHLVEMHPQATWTMNSHGHKLDVRPPWVPISGFSEDWTRNLGWVEDVHPSDAIRMKRAVRAAVKSGAQIDLEYRVRSVDGEWRWMRSRGSPRRSSSGRILGWYGCIEDVQDQRQLQVDLGEAQTQVRSLFDALRSRLFLTMTSRFLPARFRKQRPAV